MEKKDPSTLMTSEQAKINLIKKRFIIIPGFFCEHTDENDTKNYLRSIKNRLFSYEIESKFRLNFLCKKEKTEIQFYLKCIKEPFIILLLREVSAADVSFYEKFARKNKNCKVYYEGEVSSILYDEDEKKSLSNINDFTEKLEYFIMMTKKQLDILIEVKSEKN